MKSRIACLFATGLLLTLPAQAIILYGADNSANLTNPGTGLPFDSVAMVSDASGNNTTGSAIYLGNGYMLTANHVTPGSHVTFDGVTFYQWDTSFSPVQIGTVDAKIFKLTSNPTVAAVQLYGGNQELTVPAAIVGWGLGRNPAVAINTASVAWGDTSTGDKRWGTNQVADFVNLVGGGYSYTGLRTVLGTGSANEAGATLNDSGSGLFQNIGGVWYLTGLTTGVEDGTFGTSTFGNDSVATGGTENFFVRISTYNGVITGLIPEPHTVLLSGLAALAMLSRRRRLP